MSGKMCVVTGASHGIGFHTARALALKGGHVVVIGHHRDRGEQAVSRIREALAAKGGSDGSAAFALVDLSVQEQIRTFADSFKAEHDRLDVLVNNVGGFFMDRRETAVGIEMTFALNHLSYFLIATLLLDLLRHTGAEISSEPARIVNVASDAHRDARIHFDDIELQEGYSGREAYNQSKLANVLFTYELGRRLDNDLVTVNALHPGFVNTNIAKDHWLVGPLLSVIHFFFAKSPEEGAQTSIYLASSPEVRGVSGNYFIDQKPVESSPASYNEDTARRLWEISEEMTGP
jgi:NAD(P)-dependent dehydrogenase (short-subunit alcohol dehydrogenase family)